MPSHGYRAVHVVVAHDGKSVEIQARTEIQHLWAGLSEKLTDKIDPGLKYGTGNPDFLEFLNIWSTQVAAIEVEERKGPSEALEYLKADLRRHLSKTIHNF